VAAQDKKEVDLALAMATISPASIPTRLPQREGCVLPPRPGDRQGSWAATTAASPSPITNGPTHAAVADRLDLLDSSTIAAAEGLANAPISDARTSTAAPSVMPFPFGRSPYEAQRKVLDISGDGSNNDGGLVTGHTLRSVEGTHRHQRPADHERSAQPVRLPERSRSRQVLLGGPRSFVEVALQLRRLPAAAQSASSSPGRVAVLGRDRTWRHRAVSATWRTARAAQTAPAAADAGAHRRPLADQGRRRNTSLAATWANGASAHSATSFGVTPD
jgi:hypothetical protein